MVVRPHEKIALVGYNGGGRTSTIICLFGMAKDLLPIMSARTDRIASEYHLDENTAIERLYSTQLYSYLENEKTKLWYYSIYKLFDLFYNKSNYLKKSLLFCLKKRE